MKLHRDIGITQKTAWHILHKIRAGLSPEIRKLFAGLLEVDETYIGGKENSKNVDKKLNAGRGTVGKTAVIGVKDRATNRIAAEVIEDNKQGTIQTFIQTKRDASAPVYTDDHAAYEGLRGHTAVNHSAKQWTVATLLGDLAHTNGIESFRSMLKRAHHGTFQRLSKKHLNRYVSQFSGKHNIRSRDTIDQMEFVVLGMAASFSRFGRIAPSRT